VLVRMLVRAGVRVTRAMAVAVAVAVAGGVVVVRMALPVVRVRVLGRRRVHRHAGTLGAGGVRCNARKKTISAVG